MAACVQHIGFEQLQLQRHVEPITRPTRSAPDQYLARFDHLPTGERLDPQEIQLTISITADRPCLPEGRRLCIELRVAACRAGNDARADDVVHENRHRLSGVRVVADQIAHAIPEQGAGGPDLAVGGCAGATPAIGPSSLGRAIIAAGQRIETVACLDPSERRAWRDRAYGAIKPGHAAHQRSPREKPARPATGARPAEFPANARSMVRIRDSRSAADPYSTVLPS